jgi:hypothetical protein
MCVCTGFADPVIVTFARPFFSGKLRFQQKSLVKENSMFARLRGVLSLDTDTFKEIENDPSSLSQALLVVIVASLLAAIGGGFGQVMFGVGFGVTSATTFKAIAIAGWAIIAWVLWSVLTQVIGTTFYKGEATIPEMMRVIGFAYAPLAVQVFSFIPIVGIFFVWGAAVWAMAAVFVAVREGLDLSSGQTLVTVGVGWVVYLIGMGLILALLT